MRSATRKRTGKDPAYLQFLRGCPCAICVLLGQTQRSRTEVAHIGNGGLSCKSPDRDALPICGNEHHRNGEFSIHVLGRKQFAAHYGIDLNVLSESLNFAYEKR